MHDYWYYVATIPETFAKAWAAAPLYFKLTMALMVLLLIVLFVGLFVGVRRQARRERELFTSVMSKQFIPVQEFLDAWSIAKRRPQAASGTKLIDQPGCYVILTNLGYDEDGDRTYDNVYVGQSVNVCSRVRNHLTGHGNGNVYADVRNGENVSVCILPCSAEDMNDNEKALIAAFHATESYNVTRGGSRQR